MYSVLFVCTGNQYRSPIAAEAFRGQLIHDGRATQWRVGSAGTWTSPGHHSPHAAIELASSLGVDIAGHITRMLDTKMLDDASLVIVMEQGHKESIQVEFPFARKKTHLLSQVMDGLIYDIPDPARLPEEARNIIYDLVNMIRTGYGNICEIAETM